MLSYNKYFFLLLLLYFFASYYNKFPYVERNHNHDQFLKALHHYYVKNFYYELFILITYLLSYFGIFFFLRINVLGKKLDLLGFSIITLDINWLLNILICFLSIIFYVKLINKLFYLHLMRLHYYLYQYECYENLFDSYRAEIYVFDDFRASLYCEIQKYIWSKKEFDDYCVDNIKRERCYSEDPEIIKKTDIKQRKREQLRHIIDNNLLYFLLVSLLTYIIRYFAPSSRMFVSASHFILLIVLLWEIHQGVLFYIYYASFGYFLTIWVKKIKHFLTTKDPIDVFIKDYFYGNKIPYEKIKKLLDNYDIRVISNNIGEDTRTLLIYKDELIEYFLNDFVVYYAMYPLRKANDKYFCNNARRINIRIMIALAIGYYYLNIDKYYVFILGVDIKIYMILIPCYIFLSYISKKISYETGQTSEEIDTIWAEHKLYKRTFQVTALFLSIIILGIMLKNKLTIFPEETIFEFHGYIKIIEVFSLEEKVNYLNKYLEILKNALAIDKEHWENIDLRANKEIAISEDVSLKTLREKAENVISNWFKDYKNDKIFGQNTIIKIYLKIKDWLGIK